MGRFPEALGEIRRTQQVDPIAPVSFSSMGWIYIRSHLPDRAMAECQRSLDLDGKYVRGHLCIGEASEEKNEMTKAAEQFLIGKELSGLEPAQLGELRQGLQQSGYAGYFRVRLRQLNEKAKKSYVSPYDFADLTLRVGDREGAIQWLQAAYAERSPYLVFLQIEPRMDPLRNDPRFQDLIQRIGLAGIRITPLVN